MIALLDTHVFVWAIMDDPRFSNTHRAIWADRDNQLWLSFASVWEMLIKAGTGKLQLPRPYTDFIFRQVETNNLKDLEIRSAHFSELENLPPLHRDPFDRMLVAQARAEGMPVLSVDSKLSAYGVTIL